MEANNCAPLSEFASQEDRRVRIVRIGEHVQNNPDVMGELARGGIRPGANVTVRAHDGEVLLSGSTEHVRLPQWAAELMLAEPAE